jgi:hypothetical protein
MIAPLSAGVSLSQLKTLTSALSAAGKLSRNALWAAPANTMNLIYFINRGTAELKLFRVSGTVSNAFPAPSW